MTKKDNENFKNSTKCWIYITRSYRGSAYKNCYIKAELNHKISVIFDNLKNYALIMQELGKIIFKINVIPNRPEKYS